MIKLQEIKTLADFINLQASWNILLEKSDNNTIFLTWEWLKIWLETFQGDAQIIIILGYTEQKELIGIAPLIIKKRKIMGISMRCMELIGSGDEVSPDQLSFIVPKCYKLDFSQTVFNYLKERNYKWDISCFKGMQEDDELLKIIKLIFKTEKSITSSDGICPYVKLPKTWEEYSIQLSRKFRYNLGRNERLLNKDYKVSFSVVSDPESLEKLFDNFVSIHKKRMQEKKTVGISLQPIFWDFHRKVAKEFLKNNWLHMGVLKANDNIIACQYSFLYNYKTYFYQVGMETGFDKYSLGSIVIANMIKESIKRGCSEYDFLRGDEPYKFHWAKNTRRNIETTIWNTSIKSMVLYCLTISKKMLKKTLKRNKEKTYAND